MQVSDVNDIKNRWGKTRDTYDTLNNLNWLLKLFALNSYKHKKTKKEMWCSLTKKVVTAAILGFLHFYTLQFRIRYLYGELNISIKLTDSIQTVYDYCQYIVDLYYVTKYGREISLEYYQQYGNIDKILEMTYYSDIKRRLLKLIGFFIFIWMTSSLCDFGAWSTGYGWMTPIFYSTAYVFLLIKILNTIDLTSQVIHVEYRLRVMGNTMEDIYNSTDDLPDSMNDPISNRNSFYCDTCLHALNPKRTLPMKSWTENSSFQETKWLSKCYLMLTDQCTFINNMYGIRILLNSLSLLIDMVRFTNIAVRVVIGSQHTPYSSFFPAVSSLLRMMTCAAVLTSLVRHCELAYRQCERIVSIVDHLLINKNPCDRLRAAATELRGLVTSRSVSFNMANFFRLDNTFLISTASVVVTYSIILLQSMN